MTVCASFVPSRRPAMKGWPGARARAKGFSMVEVLVAILVLSFGLLGATGLQTVALQSNREARLQSEAATLAHELADMMQGNKNVALKTDATNAYLGDFKPTSQSALSSNCLRASNMTIGCADAAAVASAEMDEWLARVAFALPGARVVVCADATPFDAQGRPQWACTPGSGASQSLMAIKIGWTRASTDRRLTGAAAHERVSDSGSRPSMVFAVIPGGTV